MKKSKILPISFLVPVISAAAYFFVEWQAAGSEKLNISEELNTENITALSQAAIEESTEAGTDITNDIPKLLHSGISILIETAENFNPDRIVYREGFTYEPLPESVIKRITGLSYADNCTVPYDELRYLKILYINFDGEASEGELICNKLIAQDLAEIFYELYQAAYPIEKIRLIDEYGADDTASMEDNNTSCFNFRLVAGSTHLSRHSLGLAIDINPLYNPYVSYIPGDYHVSPESGAIYEDRSKDFIAKIDKDDLCYRLFTERGFFWGGDWKNIKDYQHFQK